MVIYVFHLIFQKKLTFMKMEKKNYALLLMLLTNKILNEISFLCFALLPKDSNKDISIDKFQRTIITCRLSIIRLRK